MPRSWPRHWIERSRILVTWASGWSSRLPALVCSFGPVGSQWPPYSLFIRRFVFLQYESLPHCLGNGAPALFASCVFGEVRPSHRLRGSVLCACLQVMRGNGLRLTINLHLNVLDVLDRFSRTEPWMWAGTLKPGTPESERNAGSRLCTGLLCVLL
jgi:hypothetical protein